MNSTKQKSASALKFASRWPLDEPSPNETNQQFKYLPFGGGPRKCIGDVFASYENLVALALLVRRFDFQMAPDAPPVNMTTGGTIHTTNGLVMKVRRRTFPVPTLGFPAMETSSSANTIGPTSPVDVE